MLAMILRGGKGLFGSLSTLTPENIICEFKLEGYSVFVRNFHFATALAAVKNLSQGKQTRWLDPGKEIAE